MDTEEAARAAWEWARGEPAAAHRGHRPRVAAFGQLALTAAAAALVAVVASPWLALVPLAAGITLAAITLLSPDRLYPRALAMLRGLGRLTGGLTTWLLLTPFFYLVLSPFGLLTRRGRRDPLTRRRESRASSYWLRRGDRPATPRHYERQF